MTLQVIGTGPSRTGTMSTRMALKELGLGPSHHMTAIFANPDQVAILTDVVRNGATNRNAVVAGYGAQVDCLERACLSHSATFFK